MTVLVSGGAGYIGAHAVLAPVDAGERVVVRDDLSTGIRDVVPGGVPLVVCDVANPGLVAGTSAERGVERGFPARGAQPLRPLQADEQADDRGRRFADLDAIVAQAFAWERRLAER